MTPRLASFKVLAAIISLGGFLPTLTLAQASGDQSSAQGTEKEVLQEVIVTAQKRAQRLQDVPVPVTAISAQTLVDSHELRIEDYFTDIPGLSFSTGARGEVFPTIRGLSAGSYNTPTVGILIDDIPYGSVKFSESSPDIDPSDLERIEVLRGPQGTLYGASGIGGLIKYVTVDPSTENVSGRLEGGAVSIHNADQLGYQGRGQINVPLGDTLAIRASVHTREDPGYIDDPVLGARGVNEEHSYGGHVALLWKPSEEFSIKLSGLLQHSSMNAAMYDFGGVPGDFGGVPGFKEFQQHYPPGSEGYKRDDEAFGITVKARLGDVDLTSLTGYSHYKHYAKEDLSFFGSFEQQPFGVTGTRFEENISLDKLSQEIRLSSSIGRHLDWLIGGFYAHERNHAPYDFLAVDNVTGQVAGVFGTGVYTQIYEERAAFADLTVHATDRFDVQLGARESNDRQPSYDTISTGLYSQLFLGSDPNFQQTLSQSENAFTYLFTPSFKISPDLMVYARLASGFRPGGPNSAIAASVGAPPTFGPDKTLNYEVGFKGDAWNRRVSFDASLYHIDWKDVQIALAAPNFYTYYANAGGAKSQGVELATDLRPLDGLTVSAWAAWNDAELTKPFPPSTGIPALSGTPLPGTTHFSGSISVEQRFPLTAHVLAFVGGKVTHVGTREAAYNLGTSLPPYSEFDLRAGAVYESWTVNLSINNVSNRYGVLDGGFLPPAGSAIHITPRLIDLSVSKTF